MKHLYALTDVQLVEGLLAARTGERHSCADVIGHLAEVARRKLHIAKAYSGLTKYCVKELGYSQYAAGRRVTAAYLVLRYPVVLDMLRAGTLHLCGVQVINPVLDDDNYEERLKAAAGKTREEIEYLVACWKPKPLPATKVVAVKLDERPALLEAAMQQRRVELAAPSPLPLPPVTRPKQLDALHVGINTFLDNEAHADLMACRDLLRHSIPDGHHGKIIGKALKLLRKELEKKKFGRTDKPRQLTLGERAPDASRTPGAQTRREVSERDDKRCCYTSPEGRRCDETAWIEFDHKIPVAAGGETSTKNVRLYCRVHNQARNFKIRPGADGERPL